MPVDPSIFFGPTLAPAPGWMRTGTVAGIPIILENWDIEVPNNFSVQNFAGILPTGNREKTLHARGTSEVTFRLIGELTIESARLALLLDTSNRGVTFDITVQQFGVVDVLTQCLADNFQLSASANGPVKYSLSGRGLAFPTSGPAFPFTTYQHPIPGWASGNTLVESWNISHQISLTPVWRNNANVLPAYYRVGFSEIMFQVVTSVQYEEYDIVSFGMGNLTITGMVRNRGANSAGHEPRTYNAELTNIDVSGNELAQGLSVTVNPVALFQGYPDGV